MKAPSSIFGHKPAALIGLIDELEKWTLVILVLFLLGFALFQIVLRNFFSMGIVWGDTLLRHVLLWTSLLGMARAIGQKKYIAIEILPLFLSQRGKKFCRLVCDAFSCFISMVLLTAAWTFVRYEQLAGSSAFLNIPLWCFQVVFPIAFAMMAVRFACQFLGTAFQSPKSEAP